MALLPGAVPCQVRGDGQDGILLATWQSQRECRPRATPSWARGTRLLRGACPERHEILPLRFAQSQNDTERGARNDSKDWRCS